MCSCANLNYICNLQIWSRYFFHGLSYYLYTLYFFSSFRNLSPFSLVSVYFRFYMKMKVAEGSGTHKLYIFLLQKVAVSTINSSLSAMLGPEYWYICTSKLCLFLQLSFVECLWLQWKFIFKSWLEHLCPVLCFQSLLECLCLFYHVSIELFPIFDTSSPHLLHALVSE